MAFGVDKLAWQSLGEAVGTKRLQVQSAYYLGVRDRVIDSRLFSLMHDAFLHAFSECAASWPKLFWYQTAFI